MRHFTFPNVSVTIEAETQLEAYNLLCNMVGTDEVVRWGSGDRVIVVDPLDEEEAS